jgi:hypothetical protein
MVEQREWVGSHYKNGISGHRIAIVGYSHHRELDEIENDNWTIETINDVIVGKQRGDSFFPFVRDYFNIASGINESENEFWHKVVFFNYLPNSVIDRFAMGTTEQIERAKHRLFEIIERQRPTKLLVFTTKGWHSFPKTREELAHRSLAPLGPQFSNFKWGTYEQGGHIVSAFGLRHPQGARRDLMLGAVKHVLDFQLPAGNKLASPKASLPL